MLALALSTMYMNLTCFHTHAFCHFTLAYMYIHVHVHVHTCSCFTIHVPDEGPVRAKKLVQLLKKVVEKFKNSNCVGAFRTS